MKNYENSICTASTYPMHCELCTFECTHILLQFLFYNLFILLHKSKRKKEEKKKILVFIFSIRLICSQVEQK